MQHRSGEAGFFIIELVVVASIVGLLLALALPTFGSYQRRQAARVHAQRISDTLGSARSLALREGNPYFVLFEASGEVQVVDDDDGDYQIDLGEATTEFGYPAGADPQVTYYGALAGPPTAVLVPEDGGGTIPSTGTTFPVDGASGLPAVGFNEQGYPVALPALVGDPPGDVGTGAGSYYVTDNDDVVYAATLLPLGGTRLRIFRNTIGDWY